MSNSGGRYVAAGKTVTLIPLEKTKTFCNELDVQLEGILGAIPKIRKFIGCYLYFFRKNPEYARALMLEKHVNKNVVRTRAYRSFKPLTIKILKIAEEDGAY